LYQEGGEGEKKMPSAVIYIEKIYRDLHVSLSEKTIDKENPFNIFDQTA